MFVTMAGDVKHDGLLYAKGEKRAISDDLARYFAANGWISECDDDTVEIKPRSTAGVEVVPVPTSSSSSSS